MALNNLIVVLILINIIGILQNGFVKAFNYPEEKKAFECMKRNGFKGVCRHIGYCDDDLNEVKQTGNVDICGFSENEVCPTVCCEHPRLFNENEHQYYNLEIKPYNARLAKRETSAFLFERICNTTYIDYIPYQFREYDDFIPSPRNDSCYPGPSGGGGIGGEDAPGGKYPHMAALGFDTPQGIKYFCGGTLITTKIVLTAAHCLFSRQYGQVKYVRLGDLNLIRNDDEADPQDFRIIRRVKHPDYNPTKKYHDIAIVELDRSIIQTKYVRPACVDTGRLTPNTELTATGWGNVGFGGVQANHLQELYIRMFQNSECRKFYGNSRNIPQGIVEELQICAGQLNVDTCEGDSGGPLQYSLANYSYFTGGFLVVGITSFGKPCALTESPGVYTRVSSYLDWLASVCF